jgi:hypothetical protein
MSRAHRSNPIAPPPPALSLHELAVIITRAAVQAIDDAEDLRIKAYGESERQELTTEEETKWEQWTGLAGHAESVAEEHLQAVIQRWRTDVPADRRIYPKDHIDRGIIVDGKLYISLAPSSNCNETYHSITMDQIVNLDEPIPTTEGTTR